MISLNVNKKVDVLAVEKTLKQWSANSKKYFPDEKKQENLCNMCLNLNSDLKMGSKIYTVEQPKGNILGVMAFEKTPKTYKVTHLIAMPPGQGSGTRLLQALAQEAMNKQRTISLEATSPSLPFYEKFKFQEASPHDIDSDDSDTEQQENLMLLTSDNVKKLAQQQ